MSVQTDRAAQVRMGVRVEVFTVLWMIVEAAVSIGAGVLAGSALLVVGRNALDALASAPLGVGAPFIPALLPQNTRNISSRL